jgi:hypothetical protein
MELRKAALPVRWALQGRGSFGTERVLYPRFQSEWFIDGEGTNTRSQDNPIGGEFLTGIIHKNFFIRDHPAGDRNRDKGVQ